MFIILSYKAVLAITEHLVYTKQLHCVSKNESTLASCSFDKYGLILIILSIQHQHTFKIHYPFVLVTLLIYFLNSCDGNDAKYRP